MRVAACQILTYPEPAKSADKIITWMRRAAERAAEDETILREWMKQGVALVERR